MPLCGRSIGWSSVWLSLPVVMLLLTGWFDALGSMLVCRLTSVGTGNATMGPWSTIDHGRRTDRYENDRASRVPGRWDETRQNDCFFTYYPVAEAFYYRHAKNTALTRLTHPPSFTARRIGSSGLSILFKQGGLLGQLTVVGVPALGDKMLV